MISCPFPLLYFPRVGYVTYGDATYTMPMSTITFENGVEESRALSPDVRVAEFNATIRCNEVDANEIISFLVDHAIGVCPFLFIHPLFGEGIVKYNSDKLPVRFLIQGNPIWYEMVLSFRPQR